MYNYHVGRTCSKSKDAYNLNSSQIESDEFSIIQKLQINKIKIKPIEYHLWQLINWTCTQKLQVKFDF